MILYILGESWAFITALGEIGMYDFIETFFGIVNIERWGLL